MTARAHSIRLSSPGGGGFDQPASAPAPGGRSGGASARRVPGALGRLVARFLRWVARVVRGEVVKRTGGPARARVVVLFALVLALNGADASTIGAIAPQLESSLHIGNTDIGLLTSVTLLIGAIFTIPVGLLVDRTKRMPLLAISIVLWSLASMFSTFTGSFGGLLLTRVALGAVAATAGPAIASLTGDYFAADERGRIWSYILVGEAAGTAFGFIISGFVASAIDWRVAFFVLSIPGFIVARELWRTVPEPLRGGQSHLELGTTSLEEALAQAKAQANAQGENAPSPAAAAEAASEAQDAAREAARRAGAEPDPERILHEDAADMPLIRAVKYIVSIPSNVLMIAGSSLGYFYFAGLQTFALLFVKGHYHCSQAEAELVLALLVVGAVIGTLVGGRLPDALLKRGDLGARVWFPGVCYVGAALLFVPGLVGKHLTPAVWFDVAGAALVFAANPPIQAARLDVVPSGLWGRAQSALTCIRSLAQAAAPLVFGGVSQLVAGIVPSQAPIGTRPHAPSSTASTALEITFLIMLSTLVAAGVLLFRARETFAGDVATAAASEPQADASLLESADPTTP
ncbi:MAG TPA: MFS transporter [Solirubrobacteraceae bacterium]|nr:MFS transporter [Solirubrobacteraceae bacterium]